MAYDGSGESQLFHRRVKCLVVLFLCVMQFDSCSVVCHFNLLEPDKQPVVDTVRGKGNKEREILVATWLLNRIRSAVHGKVFLFEHHGKPYSRIATTDPIKGESRAILGRPLSAHIFRHRFATRLLAQGKSLKTVSRFLGHSFTQITANIYQLDRLQWEDINDATREALYEDQK